MQPHGERSKPGMKPYLRLFAALSISYVVMWAIMYARVNEIGNVFLSLNQAYMAGLMAAPMLVIMLLTMGPMYENRKLNAFLLAGGVALFGVLWILLRTQAGVGDRQFLRSMIPHHAAAILVCEQASLTDPRIRELCGEIIESQRREIREMKSLMR